jgi:uncharacterized phage-associated protein
MARNKNAGKHSSYDKRGMTDEQIKKKRAYDKKFNASPEQKKKRSELNKANREAGTYGNGDQKDVTHKNGKISGTAHQSKNRGSKSDSAGDRRARGGKKK